MQRHRNEYVVFTIRFLVTEECGRLTRWLRLIGYDTALSPAQPLSRLYQQAYNEQRMVLTRNHRVQPGRLIRVIHLSSQTLEAQLRQLMSDVPMQLDPAHLFTRCDRCNVPLESIDKTAVQDRVPPYVYQTQQAFHTCPSCRRIYWAATHWERAQRVFARVTQEGGHA